MGNEFFSQDCADDDSLVSMEFSLDIGGDIRSVSIEGSEVLPSHQCDFMLELTVDAVPFPGDVAAPQSVSEMGWKGCSDHNVTMRRGGNIVSEIVIPHPGWEKVLTVLEEVN